MSRRYDSRTTIFSPEGRLYQVEYALEAILMAGTAIGVLAKDGVVLVAEKKVTLKLLETDTVAEKMSVVHDNMVCAVAGMNADAGILVAHARVVAQQYLKTYGEDIPCEQLVRRVCDVKQGYTQHGGLRPFGVSLLWAGYDERHGFQLYTLNPSGNYSGWLATSVGANSAAAQTLLKNEYKEDATIDEAITTALKVLHKTMDSATMGSDKVEVAVITKDGVKVWGREDVDQGVKDSGVLDEEKE